MKISYNWLKEILSVNASPHELASKLTTAGIQLENMQQTGDDWMLDFEVTVNRPDCLSHHGIARETAAIFGVDPPSALQFKQPMSSPHSGFAEMDFDGRKVSIRIEEPELCHRYCGQLITNIKVGPSPEWLARKLETCGLRSINNVVDITNYVMLDLGQPLHAFDYDLLTEGAIVVRLGRDEKVVLIDGRERTLTRNMLVIADTTRARAVAGVMGGQDSEVTGRTVNVLLESASFQAATVRKTAKSLELNTDASFRFERGADPEMQAIACTRAAALLEELAGGKAYPVVDVRVTMPEKKTVALRPQRVEHILGKQIEASFSREKLTALGFISHDGNQWTVPSFRVDIEKEIDLIEEIARLYGYNNFPQTLPPAEKPYQHNYKTYNMEIAVGEILRGAQIDEAYTYSFTNAVSPYHQKQDRVRLLNPISDTAAELRTELIPNLLDSVEFNLRHKNEDVRLFEIGRIFRYETEEIHLAIAATIQFRELKGIIQGALAALNYPEPLFTAGEILIGSVPIGKLDRVVIENIAVETCELNLTLLAEQPQKQIELQPIITYPPVERDLSIIIDRNISYLKLEEMLRALTIPELRSYRFIERYEGKNLPAGKISMTFRFIFQSPERTLTSEEVENLYAKIVNEFATAFGAELRK